MKVMFWLWHIVVKPWKRLGTKYIRLWSFGCTLWYIRINFGRHKNGQSNFGWVSIVHGRLRCLELLQLLVNFSEENTRTYGHIYAWYIVRCWHISELPAPYHCWSKVLGSICWCIQINIVSNKTRGISSLNPCKIIADDSYFPHLRHFLRKDGRSFIAIFIKKGE
jgi:hypothetical protein